MQIECSGIFQCRASDGGAGSMQAGGGAAKVRVALGACQVRPGLRLACTHKQISVHLAPCRDVPVQIGKGKKRSSLNSFRPPLPCCCCCCCCCYSRLLLPQAGPRLPEVQDQVENENENENDGTRTRTYRNRTVQYCTALHTVSRLSLPGGLASFVDSRAQARRSGIGLDWFSHLLAIASHRIASLSERESECFFFLPALAA